MCDDLSIMEKNLGMFFRLFLFLIPTRANPPIETDIQPNRRFRRTRMGSHLNMSVLVSSRGVLKKKNDKTS